MKTVGKTYSESIDTSLNRERIYEQKNNYLFTETDELSLDNLRTLKTGRKRKSIEYQRKLKYDNNP